MSTLSLSNLFVVKTEATKISPSKVLIIKKVIFLGVSYFARPNHALEFRRVSLDSAFFGQVLKFQWFIGVQTSRKNISTYAQLDLYSAGFIFSSNLSRNPKS